MCNRLSIRRRIFSSNESTIPFRAGATVPDTLGIHAGSVSLSPQRDTRPPEAQNHTAANNLWRALQIPRGNHSRINRVIIRWGCGASFSTGAQYRWTGIFGQIRTVGRRLRACRICTRARERVACVCIGAYVQKCRRACRCIRIEGMAGGWCRFSKLLDHENLRAAGVRCNPRSKYDEQHPPEFMSSRNFHANPIDAILPAGHLLDKSISWNCRLALARLKKRSIFQRDREFLAILSFPGTRSMSPILWMVPERVIVSSIYRHPCNILASFCTLRVVIYLEKQRLPRSSLLSAYNREFVSSVRFLRLEATSSPVSIYRRFPDRLSLCFAPVVARYVKQRRWNALRGNCSRFSIAFRCLLSCSNATRPCQ